MRFFSFRVDAVFNIQDHLRNKKPGEAIALMRNARCVSLTLCRIHVNQCFMITSSSGFPELSLDFWFLFGTFVLSSVSADIVISTGLMSSVWFKPQLSVLQH